MLWSAAPGENDAYDIYYWLPGVPAPVNLSNSPGEGDSGVQASGNRVVWGANLGYGSDIYMWYLGDGKPPARLTNDAVSDSLPRVDGDRVVWARVVGSWWDIFTWGVGDAAPINISNRPGDDYYAGVSGRRVVWRGTVPPGNGDIFTCVLGGPPVNLTNTPAVGEEYPQVSGEMVVWLGYDGSFRAIYKWVEGAGNVKISTAVPQDGEPTDLGQPCGVGGAGRRDLRLGPG